jgi:hypothetical protein
VAGLDLYAPRPTIPHYTSLGLTGGCIGHPFGLRVFQCVCSYKGLVTSSTVMGKLGLS